ncbi:hypothetical protein Tco_0830086, partial [Tanacetum coccineum]
MVMEVDARHSSSTLMMSTVVGPKGQERKVMGNTRITTQTPTNPTSNRASTSQTQPITSLHPDTQIVDKAFMIANYSQLEPLMKRMMRDLRLQGVATCLVYSSEDVDVEMKMEAPIRTSLLEPPIFLIEDPTFAALVAHKPIMTLVTLTLLYIVEGFEVKAFEVEVVDLEAVEVQAFNFE